MVPEIRKDVVIKDNQKVPSDWETFRNSVSWRDITLGLVIPKLIFYISMNKPWLTTGAAVSIAWCIGVFAVQYLRAKKVNLWAIIGLGMILIQMIPVIVKNNPDMNFIASALDTILLGLIFLASILVRKPLIQIFAEQTGIRKHLPSALLMSPLYTRAWEIITAVWALTYILESLTLLLLVVHQSGAVVAFDIFSGWPTMVLLLYFTIRFPKWYWRRLISVEE